jgi:hemolysin D
MTAKAAPSRDIAEFSPAMLQLQSSAPSPLPRTIVWLLAGLLAATLVWATLGRLDIVSVAEGRLVPLNYVQVAQPADGGIVRELLVKEGQAVKAGQVLARLDPTFSEADSRQIQNDLHLKRLQLRRIEAELAGREMRKSPDDPAALYAQVASQLQANRRAHRDALDAQMSVRLRAQQDLRAAMERESKLQKTAPIYEAQEKGWKQLAEEGYAGKLMALDRERLRIENEQELKAQTHAIAALRANIQEADQRMAQIASGYRQALEAERIGMLAELNQLEENWQRQSRKHELLELRAPGDGIVKELATHTIGAVVQPGTVLFTVVPSNEPLRAEVWVPNEDAGFVREGQPVKLKVAAYTFQKYGMVEGTVVHVGADAADPGAQDQPAALRQAPRYRALVELQAQSLERDGFIHTLSPGMQVNAEIRLGTRSVLEYVLSPVQKAFHEAGRER